MLPTQGSIQFSGYTDLYDIVVPQDHELRKLNALCENFDFIYEELKDKYCLDTYFGDNHPGISVITTHFG